jgi:DNA-binding transcriptional LysR family regulator
VAAVAPSYLAAREAPRTPNDLRRHSCIQMRLPSGKAYRWEFSRHGQELAVDVTGPLTLNDSEQMLAAAAAGLGIAFVSERAASVLIARGALAVVLDDWSPPVPGWFPYYPGRARIAEPSGPN